MRLCPLHTVPATVGLLSPLNANSSPPGSLHQYSPVNTCSSRYYYSAFLTIMSPMYRVPTGYCSLLPQPRGERRARHPRLE